MLEVSTTAWLLTIAFILVLFALDLGQAVLRPQHEVGFREAAVASVIYIAIAIGFGLFLGWFFGWQWGTEYFAGYILEKSLSVDNLFVFVVIMGAFAVPKEFQQRVLIIGIFLALILRVIFILLGAALLERFTFMFLLFGLLLIFTGIQLFRHRDQDPSVDDNAVVAFARRRLPVTDDFGNGGFSTWIDGRRMVTPLFLVLIAIGTTDVLFALDSIPAIFGVTQEVYIVFAANAFALLGLRALFFLVTGLLDRLVYLSIGLSLILGYVGVKLVLHWAHDVNDSIPQISTGLSLGVIAVVLIVTTIASIIKSRRDPAARAHAGSIRDRSEDVVGGDEEHRGEDGDDPAG